MSTLEESTGGTVWRQGERGEIEMIWACAEEGCGVYWEEDAGVGATRQEERGRVRSWLVVSNPGFTSCIIIPPVLFTTFEPWIFVVILFRLSHSR